jgi:hypothetical protein
MPTRPPNPARQIEDIKSLLAQSAARTIRRSKDGLEHKIPFTEFSENNMPNSMVKDMLKEMRVAKKRSDLEIVLKYISKARTLDNLKDLVYFTDYWARQEVADAKMGQNLGSNWLATRSKYIKANQNKANRHVTHVHSHGPNGIGNLNWTMVKRRLYANAHRTLPGKRIANNVTRSALNPHTPLGQKRLRREFNQMSRLGYE